MELKKRSSLEHKLHTAGEKNSIQKRMEAEERWDDVQEVIPGIPPRSAVHKKTDKRSTPFSAPSVFFIGATLALFMAAGGVWWFLEQQDSSRMTQATPPLKVDISKETDARPKNQVFNGLEVKLSTPASSTLQDQETAEETTSAEPLSNALPSEETNPKTQPTGSSKGEEVQLPPAKPSYERIIKHKVEPGETLYRISLRYYKTGKHSAFLGRHNHLQSPADLVSGRWIEVPFPPGQ